MFTRVVAAAFSVLLFSACEEASKNICKGLSEADCTAKTECEWNAEKDKCKWKKERPPESSAPPASSEQAPPEQSAPPAPSGPSTAPETGPGDTPPQ